MNARSNPASSLASMLLILLLSGCYISINAQDPQNVPSVSEDTVSKTKAVIRKLDEITDIYASLRFKIGISSNGETGIKDNASRMGIIGKIPIIKGFDAIMQFEVGVGLVGNKTKIKFSGDPGGAVGEIDNVFTSRVGLVGIKTDFGQFTWGKQWSVYSDIGGWTDVYNGFGAEASGTYSAGTDGSLAGTGRAANSVQYRISKQYFELGLQVQNRNITDSSTLWADTYSFSFILKPVKNLKIGTAFDKVRDGIQDPDVFMPKFGDQAWVTGLNYESRKFIALYTCSIFKNHEKDNLGNYFSGYGMELYLAYIFKGKWRFYGGFNYLQPTGNGIAGEYKIQYIDLGTSYSFGRSSKAFIETRLDDSRNFDNSHSRLSAIGVGMYFDFGY